MKRTGRQTRARRAAEGFTLLELMVALVAGLTAITSIYFVGAASTRHFHEQQRIAQTQMGLRMAMEQLRRDIQRAGFLGTPNSDREIGCIRPSPRVQAIDYERVDDPEAAGLRNADENEVLADRLILTGNYATSDAYFAAGLDGTGTTIYLQRNWQNFRRDFGQSTDLTLADEDRFEGTFRAGRFIHLTTQHGNHFFSEIASSSAADASITLTSGLPVGGFCLGGLGAGAIVAPISRIEYVVTDLSTDSTAGGNLAALDSETAEARGLAGAQLVRRELTLDSTAGTVVANSERIVLEYVAHVAYQFAVDTAGTGLPPSIQLQTGADAMTTLANNPHRVRSVIVTLSARTPEIDPRFQWVESAKGNVLTGAPPTRYKVDPDRPGASRVRTLRSEIFLTNVAARGMR